ncbi:MAG: AI-2E family transporter [Bacteroidales bacterium]|nr:AI-2E family transporter [Bacteroidales bacterium]
MKNSQIAGTIATIAVLGFMAWYFSAIVAYFLIAMVLSMIGSPIVKILDNIRIGRFRMPHTISCILALLFIFTAFGLFISIFIPLVTNQAALISQIDMDSVNENLRNAMLWLENTMHKTGLLGREQTLVAFINENIENLINLDRVSYFLNNILAFAGSLFVGIFSIVFITFFLLKEKHIVSRFVQLIVPERYTLETRNVFAESRYLLTRYFIGICIEVFSMITLISVGLTIFGVENALLIGFLGGMMNIIPYLGPVIGASMGIILGITSVISSAMYDQILSVTLIIAGTFAVANLIDNMVLQPFIYSNSVKAHPLEIFVVLLMGGSLAGVIGMILAIPTYTVIRVIASQFMSQFRLVQKLTERMRT